MKIKILIFVCTGMIIWIGHLLFYFLNQDARLKRKWHMPIMLTVAIFFETFLFWISGPDKLLAVIAIPFVALITFMNIRYIKFCMMCGSALYPNSFTYKIRYCSICGARLK